MTGPECGKTGRLSGLSRPFILSYLSFPTCWVFIVVKDTASLLPPCNAIGKRGHRARVPSLLTFLQSSLRHFQTITASQFRLNNIALNITYFCFTILTSNFRHQGRRKSWHPVQGLQSSVDSFLVSRHHHTGIASLHAPSSISIKHVTSSRCSVHGARTEFNALQRAGPRFFLLSFPLLLFLVV
jgi:hypothetical protein